VDVKGDTRCTKPSGIPNASLANVPSTFVQSMYLRSNLESHGDRSPNYVFVLFLGSLFALEFVVFEVQFFAKILPYISLECIVARGQGEELTWRYSPSCFILTLTPHTPSTFKDIHKSALRYYPVLPTRPKLSRPL
jgi:hypothetical protein